MIVVEQDELLVKVTVYGDMETVVRMSPREARALANELIRASEYIDAKKEGRKNPFEGITGGGG